MPKTLHELIASNDLITLEEILSKNADQINAELPQSLRLNKKTLIKKGEIPLETAIKCKNFKAIMLLIKYGANINQLMTQGDFKGATLFAMVIRDFTTEQVKQICNTKEIKTPVQLDACFDVSMDFEGTIINFQQLTALGYVCVVNPDLIEFFIEKGSDKNHIACLNSSEQEISIVGIAALIGAKDIVELLIKLQVDLNQPLKSPELEHKTTALMFAISSPFIRSNNNRIKLVQYLIDQGAIFKKSVNGGSTVVAAVKARNNSILTLLLQQGANANETIDTEAHKGVTPILTACILGNLDTVNTLLKNGANPSQVSTEEKNPTAKGWVNTPLLMTIEMPHFDIFKALVEAGGDIFFTANHSGEGQGRSVLTMAIDIDHKQIFDYALNRIKKSSHPIKDEMLTFALYNAVYLEKIDYAVKMLECGIDPNKAVYGNVDPRILGCLPLVAAATKNSSLVDLLIKYGAKPDQTCPNGNAKGASPLAAAISEGSKENFSKLLEFGANPLLEISVNEGEVTTAVKILLNFLPERKNLLDFLFQKHTDLIEMHQQEIYSAIHRAIRSDNIDAVDALLKYVPDINKELLLKNKDSLYILEACIVGGGTQKMLTHLIRKHKLDVKQRLNPFMVNGLEMAVLLNKKDLFQILIENGCDPSTIISEGLFMGATVAKLAIYFMAAYYDEKSLASYFKVELSEETQIAFNSLKAREISCLFAAVIFQDIHAFGLMASANFSVSYLVESGYYKGESIVAAAVFSGNIDILKSVLANRDDQSEINWEQKIESKRFASKTLREVLIEKFDSSVIDTLNLSKSSSKKYLISNSNMFAKQSANKPKPKFSGKINFGEILSAQLNAVERQEDVLYYLNHISFHMNEMLSLYNDKTGNQYLKSLNLEYHLFRIFHAISAYYLKFYNSKVAKDYPNQMQKLANTVRNIFMHKHVELTQANINSLVTLLNNNLPGIIKGERNLYLNKFYLTSTNSNNRTYLIGLIVGLINWIGGYQKSSLVVDPSQNLLDNIHKLKLNFSYLTHVLMVDSQYVTAIKMITVKIGESYQQLQHEGIDLDMTIKKGLANCKTIRDKVGHEYHEGDNLLSDNVSSDEVIKAAENCLSIAKPLEDFFIEKKKMREYIVKV